MRNTSFHFNFVTSVSIFCSSRINLKIMEPGDEIAIVGIGCNFPGGKFLIDTKVIEQSKAHSLIYFDMSKAVHFPLISFLEWAELILLKFSVKESGWGRHLAWNILAHSFKVVNAMCNLKQDLHNGKCQAALTTVCYLLRSRSKVRPKLSSSLGYYS